MGPGRADLRRAAGLRPGFGFSPAGRFTPSSRGPAARAPGRRTRTWSSPHGHRDRADLGGRQRPQPGRPVRPGPGCPGDGSADRSRQPVAPADHRGRSAGCPGHRGARLAPARRRPAGPGSRGPARRQPKPGACPPPGPNSPAAACPPRHHAVRVDGRGGAARWPAQGAGRHAHRPARRTHRDIEHIVILMQENRSFDHYFGTMPGLRGFSDPAADQAAGRQPGVLPSRTGPRPGLPDPVSVSTPRLRSAPAMPSTDHSWASQHVVWNNGKMDQWVQAKGPFTMGYFTQADIPFRVGAGPGVHDLRQLLLLGARPDWPNEPAVHGARMHSIPQVPAVAPSPTTTPRTPRNQPRRGRACSWQVYQEEDDSDDNALAWFKQFSNSPLPRQRGMQQRAAGWFEHDARQGRGAAREAVVLAGRADRANRASGLLPGRGRRGHFVPASWTRSRPTRTCGTRPCSPPPRRPPRARRPRNPLVAGPPRDAGASTVGGEPIGLGFRVPAVVASPWSAGGPCLLGRARPHLADPRHREAVRRPRAEHQHRRRCGGLQHRPPVHRSAWR